MRKMESTFAPMKRAIVAIEEEIGMKISEIITDKYKLRMPPTVYYDLLADALEAEDEQEPRWIPVSERLPENSGNYLITYCYQGEIETQEAVYAKDEEDKWFDITYIEITLAVIAWMPLPKPYEPQESEE